MEQFNTGEAAIGTGSYKLREWVTGSQIVLERPPADIGRLKTTPEVNVIKRSGERIMMLTLDSSRDVSPFVTARRQIAVSQPVARLTRAQGDHQGDQPRCAGRSAD